MSYWLIKSEPDEISIDDLAAKPHEGWPWFGVRNYQARNFMRDGMRVGDQAFFYHSSCAVPGIAGVVEVISPAYPDASQFDSSSHYFDPKATPETPRWFNVEVRFVRKLGFVPLTELKKHPELEGMRLLAKGSRLSITPVEPAEWRFILALADQQ